MDDKLVGKQEDTFLLDILMKVWLQGMPRQMCSRLGLQAMYDSMDYSLPLLAFI